ncbi:Oligoxyloglucan reducing end-specific cellobiohydrolase [Mycena epipterygia]|nr:Oligoxyloglucan reducing end-specific cellobiohydrolase [Mycena epipterygia]
MHRNLCAAFLLFIFLHYQLLAAAHDPEYSITSFAALPTRLFFFPDSTSAIYHDAVEGNIYVSSDEGRSWMFCQDIPRGVAAMFIEHPFDSFFAFVLTHSKVHFRTEDGGKTWQAFEVPIVPALVASPLSFHSDPQKSGYILYQGTVCGHSAECHDEAYVTKDAFISMPRLMLLETSRCQFSHSNGYFHQNWHPDLVYCVAFDTRASGGERDLSSSRLFSSTDFFARDKKVEELGIGRNARGILDLAIVGDFAVAALKAPYLESQGKVVLYVTRNAKTWIKAQFPDSTKLREGAFTIVGSRMDSLAISIVHDHDTIATLFVSDSSGTFFVQSVKNINRNEMGFIGWELVAGVWGFGFANVVANAEYVEGRGEPKQLKSLMTFDDGSSWAPIRAPKDIAMRCNPDDAETCSLHLHSPITPPLFGHTSAPFSPGIITAVGSVGKYLLPSEDCDTFLSTDGGVTWRMISKGPHKYSFGDSGSVLVAVPNEEGVSELRYSLDSGKTWTSYNFGVRLKPLTLSPSQRSESQKFILIGQVARKDQTTSVGPNVMVYLDLANTRKEKCTYADFEIWYASTPGSECLMGYRQQHKRRKPHADCYVGSLIPEPGHYDESCPCTDTDYECDYNYIREDDVCIPVGREKIPIGACRNSYDIFMGSSGYRKVPGNACTGGSKDHRVPKPCSPDPRGEGDIIHQTFILPDFIVQYAYFPDSTTILVHLGDSTIWQSRNEGYTWTQLFTGESFITFYMHTYTSGRAYLLTNINKIYCTTDSGRTWNPYYTPTPPNTFLAPILRFHPDSDKLIWTGNKDCDDPLSPNCHAEAQYSRDNGRKWTFVENYVVNCAWMKDIDWDTDPAAIVCESYQNKMGSQRFFLDHPALVEGSSYFTKKTKLFNQVLGFARFDKFWIVAEPLPGNSLDLQVSTPGGPFCTSCGKWTTAIFPPEVHPSSHADTMLESSTGSLFIHMVTAENRFWGDILKSDSNGTYFGLSLSNVNADVRGLIDFEKIIGLDGIALANVVANPEEAVLTGIPVLQTRITHNDGGTWRSITPPSKDSHGIKYQCQAANCTLHLQGHTAHDNLEAGYSHSAIAGVIMAVGNVGESLATYDESDMFLSRDAGLTWEEVRKDPHIWEFGDFGALLVMAKARTPIDHVVFSTDEGLNWAEYRFSGDKVFVRSIATVQPATSRRFALISDKLHSYEPVIVHLDFTRLTSQQCIINMDNPGQDDFELWSPTNGQEQCLFGRQTLYHRRAREIGCVVGNQPIRSARIEKNCTCTKNDFECEFNYYKNEADECVLVAGATTFPNASSCDNEEPYWYERAAYRKISYSSCTGGEALDQPIQHRCPNKSPIQQGGYLSILTAIWLIIFALIVAYWCYNSCSARRTIRLPEDSEHRNNRTLDEVLAMPQFLVKIAGVAWAWTAYRVRTIFKNREGEISLPMDGSL